MKKLQWKAPIDHRQMIEMHQSEIDWDLVVRNVFITEIIIKLDVAIHLATSGEEVNTSITQKKKSKGICMEGYP